MHGNPRRAVNIILNTQDDGSVSGTVGRARFKECLLAQNRGWFGKTLDIFTDYIITGKLMGNVFAEGPLTDKEISVPSNLKDI